MSHKRYLIRWLGLTVALLALPQPKISAQSIFSNTSPTEINQLSVPQKLSIPPLKQSEILPSGITESVASGQDLTAPPRFNRVITRELPALWQMRVPIEQVGSLYAIYEMNADNGGVNQFSSEQRSDVKVPIVLETLPIIEISRDTNTNTALVQGGVRLKIDLSTAEVAGSYSGELNVVVNQR
ncbi:hypothetical protein GNF10_16395 [Nostoc sp. UCD121]|uniref:hypothetical protein n=1 Tax=unclassified Nostoc TaxID=2593658 RepID=UPI0016271686|nr:MULTISPECIES: hypothetical protein [unclassified Nostoc]MBC1221481.1 hypothetical protein [Nostoc sp. UCD120]MBC1277494.1 hypothetical protein [Nostoc sp. UCD121]MBC1294796.1 hypothetical protein [Nostoc sp. UCD122]